MSFGACRHSHVSGLDRLDKTSSLETSMCWYSITVIVSHSPKIYIRWKKSYKVHEICFVVDSHMTYTSPTPSSGNRKWQETLKWNSQLEFRAFELHKCNLSFIDTELQIKLFITKNLLLNCLHFKMKNSLLTGRNLQQNQV